MKPFTKQQLADFINNGYLKMENAFSASLAEECRALLWKVLDAHPKEEERETQSVVRIGEMGQPPFQKAANTPVLHGAFDQLVGADNWLPRKSLGSFVIRFPGNNQANDTGWHVDASFPGEEPNNYLHWRINSRSKGRALLLLFLFSDVGEKDAPTRIRIGSHLDVAKLLAPAGEQGFSCMELAGKLDVTANREETLATGKAGTVYLCHPFLVHAAQEHRGTTPRFLAQPPLLPAKDFALYREEGRYSPVEEAIRKGIL